VIPLCLNIGVRGDDAEAGAIPKMQRLIEKRPGNHAVLVWLVLEPGGGDPVRRSDGTPDYELMLAVAPYISAELPIRLRGGADGFDRELLRQLAALPGVEVEEDDFRHES
jgi:hypothetical protein